MDESAPVQKSKDQSPQGARGQEEGNSQPSTSTRSLQTYLRWAISLLLAIGGIAASLAALNAGYRATIGARAVEQQRLKRLVPLLQIESVEAILGESQAVVKIPHKVKPPTPGDDLVQAKATEYIFVRRYDLVKVVANEEGTVLFLSITTRDPSFHPRFAIGAGSYVALGRSTFASIPDQPSDFSGYVGPKGQDLFYGESFWFGRPGNFQTWILGASGAGCLSDSEGEQIADLFLDDGGHHPTYFDDQKSDSPDIEKIESLRRNLRINTYTVTAPFLEPSFINSQLGIGASDYYVDTVTRRYAEPPNGTRC